MIIRARQYAQAFSVNTNATYNRTLFPAQAIFVKTLQNNYGAVQVYSDIAEMNGSADNNGLVLNAVARQTTESAAPSSVRGFYSLVDSYYSNVDQAAAIIEGANILARHYGSKLLGIARGYNVTVQTRAAGNITNAYSFYARGFQGVGAGRITGVAVSFYSALDVVDGVSGTLYHFYGVGNYRSYFGGDVGIGQTAPTAYLHIKAGTATAGDAPLKFTSGTVNTTPEAGAMEYNNTPHFTNNDATRRHIVLAPNNTKVTAGAPYTNDGYVVMNIGGTDFKVMTTA